MMIVVSTLVLLLLILSVADYWDQSRDRREWRNRFQQLAEMLDELAVELKPTTTTNVAIPAMFSEEKVRGKINKERLAKKLFFHVKNGPENAFYLAHVTGKGQGEIIDLVKERPEFVYDPRTSLVRIKK